MSADVVPCVGPPMIPSYVSGSIGTMKTNNGVTIFGFDAQIGKHLYCGCVSVTSEKKKKKKWETTKSSCDRNNLTYTSLCLIYREQLVFDSFQNLPISAFYMLPS